MSKYFGDSKAVRAFLRRLSHLNNSKYNTEKCIADFLETSPSTLTSKWAYQKKDLNKVCKLRNDISHANDYDVGEAEIERMTKFCDVLLIIALLLKLNVEIDAAIAVIDRLDGYSMINQANKEDASH